MYGCPVPPSVAEVDAAKTRFASLAARLLVGLSGVLVIVSLVLASSASANFKPAHDGRPWESSVRVQDLTHDWDVEHGYSAGEPQIAVNPANPENIIVGSTVLRNDCHYGCNFSPLSTGCIISTTFNGGRTWTTNLMPVGDVLSPDGLPYNINGDATVAAGPGGRMYAGCQIDTAV